MKWHSVTSPVTTSLTEFEQNAISKTELLPVLEGTSVSRASVHNLSIMENLELGIGDSINVYKANMIIPQISDNLTRSNNIEIPKHCPVCGGETLIKNDNDIKTLYCINDECLAKQIKSFTHFVSRDALNVEGLSEATMEKLIAKGLIKELADILGIIKEYGMSITHISSFDQNTADQKQEIVMRLNTLETDEVLNVLKEKKYNIISIHKKQ